MKPSAILLLTITTIVTTFPLHAQSQPPPAPAATAGAYEALPILNAATILQPQYFQGPNFLVRTAVPTAAGSNCYTIDSDFGVFEADSNAMLMRRVAEIRAIASLRAMSQTNEFAQAAAQAAKVPLNAAENLVTDPVATLASVPRGIFGFLNRAGEAVKDAAQGRQPGDNEGNIVSNVSGFSKTKRDIAIKLGVDPYCGNEAFQKELSKVAWPAFAGKFVVNLGMSAVSGGAGTALSAVNLSGSLTEALRDKSPTDLRRMNFDLLTNKMGVAGDVADAFLNNSSISPTTQTITVAALAQLGNIPGQAEFIRQAAASLDEHDALAYQQSVQLMANLNASSAVARITQLGGLTVCQTLDGTVVVPVQWDYAAWTPMAERFIAALKAEKFSAPVSGYSIVITGVVSPMAAEALATRQVSVTVKGLPGPLQ